MRKTGLKTRDVTKDHFSSGSDANEIRFSRLVIRIIEGTKLLASDVETGKSDPICFVWCGFKDERPDFSQAVDGGKSPTVADSLREEKRWLTTSVQPTTVNPIWNEDIVFPIDVQDILALADMKCLIFVRDEDLDGEGNAAYDDLGMIEFSIEDLLLGGRAMQNSIVRSSAWYDLKKSPGMRRVDGQIKLTVSLIFNPDDEGVVSSQLRATDLLPAPSAAVRPLSLAQMLQHTMKAKLQDKLASSAGKPSVKGRPASAGSVRDSSDIASVTSSLVSSSLLRPSSAKLRMDSSSSRGHRVQGVGSPLRRRPGYAASSESFISLREEDERSEAELIVLPTTSQDPPTRPKSKSQSRRYASATAPSVVEEEGEDGEDGEGQRRGQTAVETVGFHAPLAAPPREAVEESVAARDELLDLVPGAGDEFILPEIFNTGMTILQDMDVLGAAQDGAIGMLGAAVTSFKERGGGSVKHLVADARLDSLAQAGARQLTQVAGRAARAVAESLQHSDKRSSFVQIHALPDLADLRHVAESLSPRLGGVLGLGLDKALDSKEPRVAAKENKTRPSQGTAQGELLASGPSGGDRAEFLDDAVEVPEATSSSGAVSGQEAGPTAGLSNGFTNTSPEKPSGEPSGDSEGEPKGKLGRDSKGELEPLVQRSSPPAGGGGCDAEEEEEVVEYEALTSPQASSHAGTVRVLKLLHDQRACMEQNLTALARFTQKGFEAVKHKLTALEQAAGRPERGWEMDELLLQHLPGPGDEGANMPDAAERAARKMVRAHRSHHKAVEGPPEEAGRPTKTSVSRVAQAIMAANRLQGGQTGALYVLNGAGDLVVVDQPGDGRSRRTAAATQAVAVADKLRGKSAHRQRDVSADVAPVETDPNMTDELQGGGLTVRELKQAARILLLASRHMRNRSGGGPEEAHEQGDEEGVGEGEGGVELLLGPEAGDEELPDEEPTRARKAKLLTSRMQYKAAAPKGKTVGKGRADSSFKAFRREQQIQQRRRPAPEPYYAASLAQTEPAIHFMYKDEQGVVSSAKVETAPAPGAAPVPSQMEVPALRPSASDGQTQFGFGAPSGGDQGWMPPSQPQYAPRPPSSQGRYPPHITASPATTYVRPGSPTRTSAAFSVNPAFNDVLERGSLEDVGRLLEIHAPKPELISASGRNRLYDMVSTLLLQGRHVERALVWVLALVRGSEGSLREVAGHTKRDLQEALARLSSEPSKRGLLASLLASQLRKQME